MQKNEIANRTYTQDTGPGLSDFVVQEEFELVVVDDKESLLVLRREDGVDPGGHRAEALQGRERGSCPGGKAGFLVSMTGQTTRTTTTTKSS